jgi:small subunit ribosomal protein S17
MNADKKSRTLVGRVVGDKRDKTRSVDVAWARRHEKYGKVERCLSRFHIHDANNECKVGDIVEIKEGKPVSKTKNWYLVQVLSAETII